MINALDEQRLIAAYERARGDLLAARVPSGHWVGELSTSALSTATAVSAMALCARQGCADLDPLIRGGIAWLATHQNPDGGWGDTDKSHSNIATTMLARAAIHLAGAANGHTGLLQRAERYLEAQGSIAGLRRRYGKDKTFAVPILTNCALAGLVSWDEVSPLPFELACLPQKFYRFARMPVVSYAIPALVAIGQARFWHRPPTNPVMRWIRKASVETSLRVLEQMQPESGGYLEAVPLTSFVVMSLAATGRAQHRVTQQGLKFIRESVRPDGSWPIDTNLATWNTTLSLNALAGAGEDLIEILAKPTPPTMASGISNYSDSRVSQGLDRADAGTSANGGQVKLIQPAGSRTVLDWLLACQHRRRHAFTGADPGGWGWSDLSGAVPDADDTPGALLALAAWRASPHCSVEDASRITESADAGVGWLLGLQNGNGGWPTFCRGWGKLPFDRSGADLTAHAIRALWAWREVRPAQQSLERGFAYLARQQKPDGYWFPLWFGNQDWPDEENPFYGTAKVLMAYRDCGRIAEERAQRGLGWLAGNQNVDGSWGGRSVEETALAVEALLADAANPRQRSALIQGLDWLMASVETNRHLESSPIGFYFAKLWYYERLYPLTFTVSVLGQLVRTIRSPASPKPDFLLRMN